MKLSELIEELKDDLDAIGDGDVTVEDGTISFKNDIVVRIVVDEKTSKYALNKSEKE